MARKVIPVFVVVALLAGIGIGSLELLNYRARQHQVVVINDDFGTGPTGGTETPLPQTRELKYGEVATTYEGLEIVVTVAPTSGTSYSARPPAVATGEKRLQSQIIIKSPSGKALPYVPYDLILRDKDGRSVRREGIQSAQVEEVGGTRLESVTWVVPADFEVRNVEYGIASGLHGENFIFTWGPGSLEPGQSGYVVLQSLPELRPKEVAFVEFRKDDDPPRVLDAAANPEAVKTLVSDYEQTELLPGEGYPGVRTDLELLFHMKDGAYLRVWVMQDGHDIIEDPRTGNVENPPEAMGWAPELNATARGLYESLPLFSGAKGTDTTSTTTAPWQVQPVSSLDWVTEGLSPEEVVQRIQKQQGKNSGPIYLPRSFPSGFYAPETYASSPNPAPGGHGDKPGYSLYLTNGKDYISLNVNFAGDVGDVTWVDSGVSFEGGSFRRVNDVAFLSGIGADDSTVDINGSLTDHSYQDEVFFIAKYLVRVQ